MQQVGFLRNVNQGQRGHPSTVDVLAAFADVGAGDAVTFQSNGTVVFESDHPSAVVDEAMLALAARSGVEREGFWMPLTAVSAIVDAHSVQPDATRRELTLHTGATIAIERSDVVRKAGRRRCRIVDAGDGWFVSVNERDGESNATPLAEALTGAPATSRGIPTLVRLVDRFVGPTS